MNRSCQTCRYQEPGPAHAGEGLMYCRRFPPTPGRDHGWPLVRPDEWCGEYWREGEGFAKTPKAALDAEGPQTSAQIEVKSGPEVVALIEKSLASAPKGKPGRPRKDASK